VGQKIFFDCDGCPQTREAAISFISPRAEYTPPVIYSQESREKLVFRVEATMTEATAKGVNPGQPVDVVIP